MDQSPACAELDKAEADVLFFPRPGAQNAVREAKEICARCPVKAECLAIARRAEDGRATMSRYGIYGGLTATERAHLTRKPKRRALSKKCARCGAELRGARVPASSAPGTKRYAGRGLCAGCYTYHRRHNTLDEQTKET